MNRRELLAAGMCGALGGGFSGTKMTGGPRRPETGPETGAAPILGPAQARELFPRARNQVFLNAAGGTPLGTFAARGIERYEELWRSGPGSGLGEWFADMLTGARAAFAGLIGADSSEIAFVHCTKAGEQIVLDGLPALRDGGNVVSNDLHFAGSLHNLVGLQRSGVDVRIVRARDWQVRLEDMEAAIDDRTALVAVTLVSNINGHIEPMRELAELAHARGAHVYADIIQAAGIVPIDVRELGIDFAASNGYKWLYGPHGAGFLYVRGDLQGTALADRLFPGNARHNYAPWVPEPDPTQPDYVVRPPTDAQRYQPGHVSYLCYAAVSEGLRFINGVGVESALQHSLRLTHRLRERLDPARYECISPHVERSPIITFETRGVPDLEGRLRSGGVVVALLGNGRLRVSPAIYNDESDIDALVDMLNRS